MLFFFKFLELTAIKNNNWIWCFVVLMQFEFMGVDYKQKPSKRLKP